MFYTGIGSRETPFEICQTINKLAKFLEGKDYTLRSGGACGADAAFELGINNKEIYLPWKNFNNNSSSLYKLTDEGFELAIKYHPKWVSLSSGAQKLMIRNGYQVLGFDLKTPSKFVICWTKDGKASGGTGQAIRIAKDYSIPIYNLFNESDKHNLLQFLKNEV